MVPCGGNINCQIVLTSRFSEIFGVHVSFIGLAGYIGLFVLALLRSTQTGSMFRKLATIGFVMSAVGLVFSLYLTFVSLAYVRFTCTWCLTSLATVLVTTIMHAALLQAEAPKKNDRFMGLAGAACTLMIALGAASFAISSLQKDIDLTMFMVDPSVFPVEEALPEQAKVIGSRDAKVTIIEFIDINCIVCRATYPKVKDVLKKHGNGVRLGFRHFVLMNTPGHETSLHASMISELAAENDEFWKFMDYVMAKNQTDRIKTIDGLMAVAGELGYSRRELVTILSPDTTNEEQTERSKEITARVAFDMDMGIAMKVAQTPTFIIYAEGETPLAVSFDKLDSTLMSSPYRELIKSSK